MNDVAAEIPAKWRFVALQLGLPSGLLDGIQTQTAGIPNGLLIAFEKVLTEWDRQKTKPYTWETIINTLRKPSVNECALADAILTKYCS